MSGQLGGDLFVWFGSILNVGSIVRLHTVNTREIAMHYAIYDAQYIVTHNIPRDGYATTSLARL